MIQPKIEKVYKDIKEEFVLDFDLTAIEQHEGYFFTPEEFEQFKREFGRELLEREKAKSYMQGRKDDYLLNNKI
jgi:hypothetical protein